MFHSATRRLATAFAAAVLFAPPILAQGAGDVDRQAMYSRYVEFAQSLRGSSVDAHWMANGSSFWYAEGAPANTIIWKVDPIAKPYDLIVLPDQPHVPTGNSWTYMRDRIAHYFQEHLKTGRDN